VKKYHQKAGRWIAIGVGMDDDGGLEYIAYQLIGDWKQSHAFDRAATAYFGTPTLDAR